MRIVGVTVDEFVSIVAEISPRYGGNLIVHKDAHNVAADGWTNPYTDATSPARRLA